ncbi:hypothetical protein [Streptomyces sp. 7N604]|uniref:hypothetical protein n=1 Tax=Streptomyces sp. 7N604 TaxID=3457415 RepID=UPI003FD14902
MKELQTLRLDDSPVGLDNAWHWSPVPGLDFAGALSADGKRLLQLSARESYREDLAVAALEFAREHEEEIFAQNSFLGAAEGFKAPGYRFDTVAAAAPEVHEFYEFENPALNPLVRVVFPAYACEFSGREELKEAVTRFQMLRPNILDREPVPFLKMRYANTKTGGRSTNPGRGFTELRRLVEELGWMDGGAGSFVEFENRHGNVWRVEWHGAWYIADWDTESGTPREIGLDELLAFAEAKLRD